MVTDQFTVGQWVRVTGPNTDPDQGRVAQIGARRFASYMVRFTDGRQRDYEVSAAETDFEKWEPRPGERVKILTPGPYGGVGLFDGTYYKCLNGERHRAILCEHATGGIGPGYYRFDLNELEPVFEEPKKFTSGFVEPGRAIVTRSLNGPDEWTPPTEWTAAGEALDDLATHLGLPRRDDGETDAAYHERLGAFVTAFNAITVPGQVVRFKRPEWTQQERTERARPSPTLRAEKRMADVREVLGGKWEGRKR